MRISSAGKTKNQNSLPSLYDENFHDGDLRKLLKFQEDLWKVIILKEVP